MNIKVGDKIKIKQSRGLLRNGWENEEFTVLQAYEHYVVIDTTKFGGHSQWVILKEFIIIPEYNQCNTDDYYIELTANQYKQLMHIVNQNKSVESGDSIVIDFTKNNYISKRITIKINGEI
jgi:hypothetical protein